MTEAPNTCAQALRAAAAELAQTSDTARLDAELLMAHALGVSRSDLLLWHMQDATPDSFAALVKRRTTHEPVAYIVRWQEFFGLPFVVSPAVLIPRADSEVVVQAALDAVAAPRRVLDLGTGSGALLLSVLEAHQSAEGVGLDASQAALSIARQNARFFGDSERTHFLHRDWTQPGWADDLGQFDLVVANPPYVESEADLAPDVREFEPSQALFAGPEGLDDYRILIPQLPSLLKNEGVAVLEIGSSQAEKVKNIASVHGFTTELHHDLGQRPRALVLRLGLGKAGVRG